MSDGPGIPNFFLLGAAKCGTTSLASYIEQHPDVYVADVKEPIFFEAEYERGLDYYVRHYFPQFSGQRAVGDARTYNLYLPYVPERIHASYPEAKLVALLREPVSRAYSHWWHRTTGRLERRSFAEAIEANLESLAQGPRFVGEEGARAWAAEVSGTTVRHPTYLDLGYYAEQLRRYLALFPASRVKVFLYDDLVKDPAAVTRAFWEFIGVDPHPEALDTTARNTAHARMEGRAWKPVARLYASLGISSLVPRSVKKLGRRALQGKAVERPPLDPKLRVELQAHFRERNADLAQLLSLDLSEWEA